MNFKASMDKTTTILTATISVLFIVIIIFQFLAMYNTSKWVVLITYSFLIILYLIVVLFKPRYYNLNYEELIINRTIGNVSIRKIGIKSVEIIDKEKLKGSIRTFGVGGLFGYFGKFYNSSFGAMTWYATRRSNYVLIKTSTNKKIIITPNNPDDFVKEFYKL